MDFPTTCCTYCFVKNPDLQPERNTDYTTNQSHCTSLYRVTLSSFIVSVILTRITVFCPYLDPVGILLASTLAIQSYQANILNPTL